MRTPYLLSLAVCSVAVAAHAEGRIVVMTDSGGEDGAALQLALANRLEVSQLPAPEGALPLDRAATVQHAALADHAAAGLWIEHGPDGAEVCVVSSDGLVFRRAPLPESATPRAFAAIASSLVDEVLAPPEPPGVGVDVHVDVQPPAAPPAMGPPAILAPPPRLDASLLVAPPIPRADRTLLEVGPTLSTVSYGLEAELAIPLLPRLRIGVLGGVNWMFDGFRDEVPDNYMYDGGLELRYVGAGTTHFDVGVAGGIANAMDDNGERDTGGFTALRLSVVHESDSAAVSLSLSPMLLFDFLGQDGSQIGLMGSVRLQLPL